MQRRRGEHVFELLKVRDTGGSGVFTKARPLGKPSDYWEWFDEFFFFIEGDAAENRAWVITTTDGDADGAEKHEIAEDEPGGVLHIYTNDKDDDSEEIQSIGEIAKLASGKELWFEARLKVDDADKVAIAIGLAKKDTTFLDTVNDCAVFIIPLAAADGKMDFVSDKDGTPTTVADVATLGDGAYVWVGFYFDGAGKIRVFVDGTEKTSVTANICDDEALAITYCIQNEEAANHSLKIDRIHIMGKR